MEAFRGALESLGMRGQVAVVDSSATAPAFHLADAAWQVPPCRDPDFIPAMLHLCEREGIGLLVPTIDTELPFYAEHNAEFARIGTRVAVSGPETVDISADKVRTHAWLLENHFPTVRQARAQEVLRRPALWTFPVIAKPRGGSAGMGVLKAASLEALKVAAEEQDDLVVQDIASGREHTVNVYVDRIGNCRCAVPHLRLEVRAGEVSKAVTVKNEQLMQVTKEVAEALPDAYGALNIQCFLDGSEVKIIEINPRFGGGYPLAHAAGADFPKWLLQEAVGLAIEASFDQWQDNLAMLRYDEAVFVSGELLGERSAIPSEKRRSGDGPT